MPETSIEWTNRTWNPVRGCTRVTEGCRNCYAERQAARYSADADRPGAPAGAAPLPFHGFAEQTAAGPRWTGKVELVPEKLGEPLSWTKPQKVFVNSMSDLFHERLPFEDIAAVLGVISVCSIEGIIFQVLTKRSARLPEFHRWLRDQARVAEASPAFQPSNVPTEARICHELALARIPEAQRGRRGKLALQSALVRDWPPRNLWQGVSVERQQEADERIPKLLDTPAAVHFVSYEPALGPVDFARLDILPRIREAVKACAEWSGHDGEKAIENLIGPAWANALTGHWFDGWDSGQDGRRLDWIIVGGESGPGARPFDIAWARETVRQCREAGVAVFVKQLGAKPRGACSWAAHEQYPPVWLDEDGVLPAVSGRPAHDLCHASGDCWWPCSPRLNNHKGGNPDEWPEDLRIREFPEVAHA